MIQLRNDCLLLWLLACLLPATCGAGEPVELDTHTDAVYDIAFSPDGKIMASGSYDKTVILWDLSEQRKLATLSGHSDQVFRVAFSPDGKTLASCSGDGTVIVWDVSTRTRKHVLAGHGDPMLDAAFSRDGKIVGSAGSHIQLWKGSEQLWSTPHSELFFSIDFSPDKRLVACGTKDLIHFYSVTDAELLDEVDAGSGMVYQVEYSPESTWLAAACSDGNLSLWDAKSRTRKGRVKADNSALFTCAFSPDGKRLASGGRERVVRIWETPTLKPVSEWRGPKETVLTVRFSRDAKWLAAGSYDGKIHLWPLESPSP